jgi:hypothetical protein
LIPSSEATVDLIGCEAEGKQLFEMSTCHQRGLMVIILQSSEELSFYNLLWNVTILN